MQSPRVRAWQPALGWFGISTKFISVLQQERIKCSICMVPLQIRNAIIPFAGMIDDVGIGKAQHQAGERIRRSQTRHSTISSHDTKLNKNSLK